MNWFELGGQVSKVQLTLQNHFLDKSYLEGII